MWLLVCVTVASGQTRQPPVTVAVMAGDDAPPAVEVFAAALTTVLRDQSITLIDRSRMRKLLAEHELSVGGVIRDPLAIGKMIGAQYLIYLAGVNSPAQSQPVVLMMIEVNSGNVLAETACADDAAEALGKTMTDAIAQARRQADQPAATVLSVIDRSGSHRLRFFQAALQGTLDRMIEQRGWRMLRRSHALELSKETTLSTAGLIRPDAEVLARAADLVVSAEYREQPAADKAFGETPIELTLSLRQDGKTSDKRITFTLDGLAQLERELLDAIPSSDGKAAPETKSNIEEQKLDPRLEAAQLLAQLDRRSPDLIPWEDRPRQAEMCRRIVYLDSSSAEGYYRLGVCKELCGPKMAPAEVRRLVEESRYALTRYLQFPRTQSRNVGLAFYYLEVALADLMNLSRDDPAELDRLCEQVLAVTVDYINWFVSADNVRTIGRYETIGPFIGTNFHFENWLKRQPKRYAELWGWLADRVASNPSFPDFMVRTAEMDAAGSYDHVGDLKIASEYFYRAASRLQKWDGKYIQFRNGYGLAGYATTATVDRYAKYYTDEQRTLLKRLLPEPSQEKPWVDETRSMYGDFFGKLVVEKRYHADRADEFWLKRLEYQTAVPEKIEGPAGVLYMPKLFRTRDDLWMVGISGVPAPKSPVTYALYHMSLKDGTPAGHWEKIAIPEGLAGVSQPLFRGFRGIRSRGLGALQIAMMVQAGDDVLWCGGTLEDGKAAERGVIGQTKPVFVYNLKTRAMRVIGMEDGLPEEQVMSVHSGEDGQSAWIVTKRGFLTRYRDGKVYLSGKSKSFEQTRGWTFSPQVTLMLGLGQEFWIGEPGGRNMKKRMPGYEVMLSLLPKSCFRPVGDLVETDVVDDIYVRGDEVTAQGDGDLFAVVGDRAYMGSSYGLVVMGLDGRLDRVWRKNLYCNFRYLAGFIEGNSPLPPAPIVKVLVDEREPDRLWIVSRHKYMVGQFDETPLRERPTMGGGNIAFSDPGPNASSLEPPRYPSGLFITAFDTGTGRWSMPIFVKGDIGAAVPSGDQWYFAGKDFSHLPKSMWVCNQAFDPDAKLNFVTADTLHGWAARALFDGNREETRRLLMRAIDEGIAVDDTQKILKQLDAWERDHPR